MCVRAVSGRHALLLLQAAGGRGGAGPPAVRAVTESFFLLLDYGEKASIYLNLCNTFDIQLRKSRFQEQKPFARVVAYSKCCVGEIGGWHILRARW